jgi:hypothetical protein
MKTINWINAQLITILANIVVSTIIIAGSILLTTWIVCTIVKIVIRTILTDYVEFFIGFIPNNDNDIMDLKYDMVEKLSILIGRNRIYRADVCDSICPGQYKLHLKCKLPAIKNKNNLEFSMYQLMKTYSDKMKLISITRN